VNYCPECGNNTVAKFVDGSTRFVCSDSCCHFVHWNNPVPVVAALVIHNNNYLIARNAEWPKGVFSLIAGYLEAGEKPEDAVNREVSEELGLEGTVTRCLGHYSFFEKNQLIIAFEVVAEGCLATNHELAETLYLSRSELLNYNFGALKMTEQIINHWAILSADSGC